MLKNTNYEWDIEEQDEYGDIVDHNHADKLTQYTADEIAQIDNKRFTLVLVRTYDDMTLGGYDRSWAYVENMMLPEEFDNGIKVPKRFRDELVRFIRNSK